MGSHLTVHILALIVAYFLDLILGDPYSLPHPIRLIGNLISFLEKLLYRIQDSDVLKFRKGLLLVVTVIIATSGSVLMLLHIVKPFGLVPQLILEGILIYYTLAARCLQSESMKVYYELESGSLSDARRALSMIVGRDTEKLTEEEVIKAAVETVAENTSDGVIAPLLYAAFLGPVGAYFYKAVNTMDSMLGYKNERYLYFGRAAARLDDIVNFVPSRLSAVFMLISAMILGKDYDFKNALRIFWRDRLKHASPNSAQTESVAAGSLSLKLAGDASYFGQVVHKESIGDPIRDIERKDIQRINRMMFASEGICLLICIGILMLLI